MTHHRLAFLFLLVLWLAAAWGGPSAAGAAVFSDVHLTFDAISPNGDGVQEFTEIRYTIAVDSADVRILLAAAGGNPILDTLQVFTRQGGTRTLPFDGSIASGPLDDGTYQIEILGIGTQGEGSESQTLPLTVDRVAPEFTALDLVEPEEPVVQDGMRLVVQACLSGEPESVVADFSALDTEYDPSEVSETPVGQTCRRFSYAIHEDNALADQADLPVVVTARDRAGNTSQQSLAVCLSNSPPRITEASLLNQFTVFQNGDMLLMEVHVQAVNPVTVTGDFSNLDSDFREDRIEVTDLGGNQFRLAYTLASGNVRPDGPYTLHLFARDVDGCGVDEDSTLTVTLDNRGLLPALIDDVRLSVPAVSPADGNGVNDSLTVSFTVLEDTVLVAVIIQYHRKDDPERWQTFSLVVQDFPHGPNQVTWDGQFPDPFDRIGDQMLNVIVRAISAAKDRQRSVYLQVELDQTPPQFLSFRPPEPATIHNGDRVDFSVVLDRPQYAIRPDFSALDSNFPGRSVAVTDSGNGAYGISYVVSETNTTPDGNNKIIPITATDLAGNTATDEGFVRLCLSNQPPRLVSAELMDNPGPFKNGDQIAIRSKWTDGRWETGKPLHVSADFSAVDTEFGSRTDKVTVIEQPREGSIAVFDIAYRISGNNDLEQADGLPIRLTAEDNPDLGCASTTVTALTVDFDSLDPLRPVLHAPPAVVRTPVITLSGEAEESVIVHILREQTVIDTFTVDAAGRFSGEVELVPGENTFTAEGVDRAGNVSKPSPPVQVFFVEGDLFRAPGRFAPGDEFFVGLHEAAARVTVRVFNLEGVEVARLDGGAGDLFHISWDGRDAGGNLLSSGPYLAVVDVDRTDGGRERMRQAFFFSRRGR